MATTVLVALLLAAAPLPPEGARPGTCALRMQVVDEHGEPVAGARVAALSLTVEPAAVDRANRTATGEDGRARLALPPGLYRWAVASERHPTTPVAAVDLRGDCGSGDLGRLRLPAGASITGRVVDATGEPLPGAEVEIGWDPHTPRFLSATGDASFEPHRVTLTGPDGAFRLEGLTPGTELTLWARLPGYRGARRTAPPGTEPLLLTLDPAARLAVEVVDPDGRGVEGADVDLQPLGSGASHGGFHESRRTDEQGRFSAESLEPGTTAIEVRAPGYEHARRVVELEAGTLLRERFEVAPVPSGAITVRVVDEEGAPVPDAQVHLASTPRVAGGTYLSGRSDARGIVAWPRVARGRYEVTVAAPKGVPAVRPEPVPVEVGAGATRQVVVLRRPDGRPVEGRVLREDGTAVAGASVRVFAGTALEAVTGADGRFRFDHLPYGEQTVSLDVPETAGVPARKAMVADDAGPWHFEIPQGVEVSGRLLVPPELELTGQWRITARSARSRHAVGWMEDELRYRFPPLSPGAWTLEAENGRATGRVEVELAPGDREVRRDLAVEPAHGFPVTGILLHRGRPLAGAPVGLSATGPGFRSHADTTGPDGHFEIAEVPAGTYTFSVGWEGVPVLEKQVEIEGATDLGRELRFAWLRGRVVVEGVDPTTLHVRLHPRAPDGEQTWVYSTHSYPERAVPRPDGSFEAGPLREGPWRIEVSVPGHAEARREIVVDGADVEDLVLAPEPTEGLTFRLVAASGRLPDHASVTYRPEDGEPIRSYFDVREPELHLAAAPRGRGTLEVDTGYGRVGPLPVEVPGPVAEVELPPRGKVLVRAPLLGEAEAARAVLTITPVDGDGASRTCTFGPHGRSELLPPGHFEVRVDAEDGRSWSRTVEVRDQETTEVVLR